MRVIVFLLGLGLISAVTAQEPAELPPDATDTPLADDASASTPPIPVILPDAALERHFPVAQQRRLGEGSESFLALWLPAARPTPLGAVLLVGDHGEHADWPELIGPARRQLSEAGWNTLAMALPTESLPVFGLSEELLAQRSAERQTALTDRLRLGLAALSQDQDDGLPTTIIARGRAGYWALTAALEDQQIAGMVLFQPRAPSMAEPGLDQLVSQWDRPLLELIPGNLGATAEHLGRASDARRLAHPNYHQWQLGDLRTAAQNQTMMIRRLQGWLGRIEQP